MATTYYNDIQKLYVAYFNRPADPKGLAYWETVVEAANGNTAAVSAEFATSAEYKAAYAGMTNAQIVDKVYQNLFGRPAEDAGKAYWADLLDKGSISIDNVVAQVAGGALTTDLAAYNAKVSYAAAFTAAVDTDAEIAGYNGDAANAAAKALMADVKDAATLAAATATLDASVASVVAAGTPFTVVGALQALEAAQDAKTAFLDAYDGKADGKVTKTDTDVTNAVATKDAAVAAAMTNANGTNGTAYTAATSDNVKAAIVADEVALNAKTISDAQADLKLVNADIAKVAGLSSAIAALTAATAADKSATDANTAASADLAAKIASFKITSSGDAAAADAQAADGTITGLIVKTTDGTSLKLATGVTEADHPGITAVLNASIAHNSTVAALQAADANMLAAQFQVSHLDVDPANATNEANELGAIKALMVDFTSYLTGNTLPTEAQIAAQQKILDSKDAAAAKVVADVTAAGGTPTADQTNAATNAHNDAVNFKNTVDSYHADAAASDPLATRQQADTQTISDTTDAATALAKATADLAAAKADVAHMTALNEAVTAAEGVFADHDFTLVDLTAAYAVGSSGSDVFVLGNTNTTISLFGLQGDDQLFVGSGYKLNTGALSTGDDAALEVFVKQVGTDTTLTVETSKFGSHASTPEVVTVTLIGVTATDVHLDSNGIITVA